MRMRSRVGGAPAAPRGGRPGRRPRAPVARPHASDLPGGNTHDCTQFTTVMDAIGVPRLGPGRPRT
ncbi:hypothetical protein ACFVZX_40850, partial [Streptomyces erythrochromogenes]